MARTKQELIRMINMDEPEYEKIVTGLTEADIPLLNELAADENTNIARKAISCLGMMDSDKAFIGLEKASENNNPVLRVAAAHGLRNMTKHPKAEKLLSKLLDDPDVGVRKFALKTVDVSNFKKLKEKIKKVHGKETNEQLKTLSRQILEKL